MAAMVIMDNLMQHMARHEARRHLPPLQQTAAPAENGVSMETSQIAKYQRKLIVNNKKGTGGIVFGIYDEKC